MSGIIKVLISKSCSVSTNKVLKALSIHVPPPKKDRFLEVMNSETQLCNTIKDL